MTTYTGRLAALAITLTLSAVVAPTVAVADPSGPPEDSPAFDCRHDGNRVCGPGNDQGVPAGDYSQRWLDYSDDFSD